MIADIKCPHCGGENFRVKNIMTINGIDNPAGPELKCNDCGAETRQGRWVIDIPHPQGSMNMQVYLDSPEYADYMKRKEGTE